MNERPSGTVTFLFTDIEGSTRLWEHHHRAMKSALSVHDDVVRSIIESRGGYVFSTGGDSFSAAFSDPIDAAVAALDIHRELDGHDWDEIGELRVRAAIDTGLADERDGDYFGPPLNRAARILGHAHGGDTLCSHTTADLLKHDLPAGYSVIRLGRRRLKGVEDIETLFRIAQTGEAALRPRWMTTATIVAGIAAIGLGWWGTSGGGTDPEDPASTTTAATTTTASPAQTSEASWTTEIGPVDMSPIVVDDVVVVAIEEPARALVALDRDTGLERWKRTDLGSVQQIATDGTFVYVTTGRRLDILNPTDGDPVPRCGFDLPKALASTIVNQDAAFVLTSGVAYRIEMQPGNDPCQSLPTENARFIDGYGELAGVAGSDVHLLAGDARGLYLFEVGSLNGVWRLPDAEPVVRVRTSGLALVDVEIETRTELRPATTVVAVDEDGLLHLFDASDGGGRIVTPQTLVTAGWTPMTAGDSVIIHQPDGVLLALDGVTGTERWRLEIDEPPPVHAHDDILAVAIGDRVLALRGRTGEQLWSLTVPETPLEIHLTAHEIVTSSDASISLIERPDAEERALSGSPEVTQLEISPETVVREFVEAWSQGDARRAEGFLAPHMRFPIVGVREPMWPAINQEYFWSWFQHDVVMGASWDVNECERTGTADSTSAGGPWAERIECDVGYSDRLVVAEGSESVQLTAVFEVTNGLIQLIGEEPPDLTWGGRWAMYGRFDDWANETYPDQRRAACIETGEDIGPECAEFTVAHLDEWAENLGS